MRRHLLIAGTGRSGTSFLVRFFSEAGLDTHLSRSEVWDENAQAGLEDLILHGDDHPYVIKSPWLYEYIDQVLARDDIKIDGVIMPMRDITEASVSRTILEMRNAHQRLPFMADEVKLWETISHTPGGTVFSLNPLDQARLLALGFHNLILSLTRAEVPIYFVEFPRMVSDFDYLFRNIRAVLPADLSETAARAAFDRSADVSKVRATTEMAFPGGMSVAAKYPSNLVMELAAIRRELKRLRSERDAYVSSLTSDRYCVSHELLPGRDVVQRFSPFRRLGKISTRFVTFDRSPSSCAIDWTIVASIGGDHVELGAGQFDAGAIEDWKFVDLAISHIPDDVPSEVEVRFQINTDAISTAPIGIPCYHPASHGAAPPAQIGDMTEPSGAQVGLSLMWAN